MIINSSQNIQSSSLDTSSAKRVNGTPRSSNTDSENNKQAEKVLKQQDQAMLTELRARDREVRAHEAAHVSAGGSLVRSGPSYTLQKGPDGRSYAIGGEVQLDVSAVDGDPEATLVKAGIIRSAALAPADPSAQDRRVASNANQLASRARVDIAVMRREEAQTSEKQDGSESESTEARSTTAPSDIATPKTRNNLQSNDVPVAAISAFMATAQSEVVPVRFSQFA